MGAKPSSFRKKLLTSSVVLAMGASQAAFSAERVVEEVLVTATKRTTTLQETPLAISAIDADNLREKDIVDLRNLRGNIPNLQFVQNQGHATPLVFIRGLGTLDQTEAGDQGIAFYVDGVYTARSQGTTVMMYDMERVEVLRGPQGTLFGRNSTGGAISLITAKPELGESDGSVEMTIGSNNRMGVKGMVNVPVTDTWALRFAGAQERRDGLTDYAENNIYNSIYDTGRQFQPTGEMGEVDLFSWRASSQFEPTDSLRWFLSYEQFRDTGSPDALSLDYKNRVNRANGIAGNNLLSKTLRTRLDWDLNDDLTVSYIGGGTTYKRNMLNADQYGNMQQTTLNTHEATQHELQLANSDENRLRWTVGAYMFEEENYMHFDMPVSYDAWGGPTGELNTEGGAMFSFLQPDRGLESQSGYAQGTFDITDIFRVTAGVRYTEDTRSDKGGRSIDCTYRPESFPSAGEIYKDHRFVPTAERDEACYVRQYNDMEETWDSTTYTLRFEYDLTDDIMLFASNSTGWKSGVLADGKGWENLVVVPGFENVEYQYRSALLEGQSLANYEAAGATAVADANTALDYSRNLENIQDPEEVDAWEIGMKSQFGPLTLNANIFYMDFTDMQVTAAVINPITQESTLTKTNAGSATSQGLEVEAVLLVGDAGTLSGSFAYLDASYDEFYTNDGEFGTGPAQNGGGQYWNQCAFGVNAEGNCTADALDFSGNTMPYAPELQLQLSYKHEIGLGNGNTLVPRITLTYFDDMYLDAANRGDRPAGVLPDTLDEDGNVIATDPGQSDMDVQPAYAKIDVGVTYKGQDDKWSVDVFANNITDEEIRTSNDARIDGGYSNASTWEEGRALGLRLNYNF